LSLCDFCVFGPLKKVLKGGGFGSRGDIKATVVQWLQQQCGGNPSAGTSMGTVFNSLYYFAQKYIQTGFI
jgi:hypothetical protein